MSARRQRPPTTGKGSTPAARKKAARAAATARESASRDGARPRLAFATTIATWAVFAIALLPPLLVSATADDAFRLPKTAAAETLALFSLLAIAIGWWSPAAVSLAELARRPATALAALLVVAVLPGAVGALHPQQWARATTGLVIGLGCLVLWSARLAPRALRRALDLLVVPAALLALLAVLQAHGIFQPFDFSQAQGGRMQLTSLAGSVGDLAAFLVLPVLVLQADLLRARSRWARITLGATLALLVYTLLLSETLAALVAAAVGCIAFWAVGLPARARWRAALALATAAAGAVLVPGLRHRLNGKIFDLRQLDLDALLSGRPDGWKAALEMFRQHPWLGVGHGGYSATFAPTKLALHARGVEFWSRGRSAHFANAHNDYLEALAEWGALGAIAALAAAAVLVLRLRRFARAAPDFDRALAIAGCVSCAVLALASFPLRIALTAYPWLLLVTWIFAGSDVAEEDAREPGAGRVMVPAGAWSLALCLLLAPAVVLHTRALLQRLEASRIVHTTGEVAQLAMRSGPAAARPVLQTNLGPLRRAAELDPVAVAVPMTTGSHYFLLGNDAAAIESYRRALALEPREELYSNLARVLLASGKRDEAVAAAADAAVLDPAFEDDAVQLGLREPQPGDRIDEPGRSLGHPERGGKREKSGPRHRHRDG